MSLFYFCFGVCFGVYLSQDNSMTRSPIQQPTVCFLDVFVFVGVRRNRDESKDV
jgi:hypothetical protein